MDLPLLGLTVLGLGQLRVVSPAGHDGQPGTEAAPWRTIQKAARAARPGERVVVLKGTYEERVQFDVSGKEGVPIVFEAVGEVVVKGPESIRHWEAVFDIRKKSHLVLKGFRIQDSNWFGIGIHGSDSITVTGCSTSNTQASGIYVRDSTNIVVENNDVTMACLYEGDRGGSQECISIASVRGFRVSGNRVHDTKGKKHGGEGIDAKESAQDGVIEGNHVWNLERLGIYVDSWNGLARKIVVRRNIIHDCSSGIAVSSEDGGTVEDLRIENNLVYRNRGMGIVISSWEKNGPKRNIEIVNNTVVGNRNPQGTWGVGLGIEKTDATGVVIRNNICALNASAQIQDASGRNPLVEYNLVYSGRKTGTGLKGQTFVEADPLFLDPDREDFHLRPDSPAINAGTSTGAPAEDLEGFPRPYAGKVDLGCYEFHPKGAKPPARK